MSFEIRFTFEAEETYKAVVAQLLERWGNKFVIKFQTKIYKSLETISKSPYIYPIAEENTGIRKCILHKNCSLLYKIFDDRVEIICFWDNRQDPLIIF